MSKVISKYFTLEELCGSTIGDRHGIINRPSSTAVINLQALTTDVLDAIRLRFGATIVNSGFRCTKLNRVIPGSSKRSQHQYGEAADIVFPDNSIAFKTAVAHFILNELVFDKLIIEYWNGYGGWIHISYKKNIESNRKLLYVKDYGKKYSLLNRSSFDEKYPLLVK